MKTFLIVNLFNEVIFSVKGSVTLLDAQKELKDWCKDLSLDNDKYIVINGQ